MTDINEIIGRALLTLDHDTEERSDLVLEGPVATFTLEGTRPEAGDLLLDGTWSIEAIGAAVVKALGEAGYSVAKVMKKENGKVTVLGLNGRLYEDS